MTAGSTRLPGHLGQWSDGPGPRLRGFDQISRATRARVRVPVGSTSSPGQLALVSEVPQCRPPVLGDSGLGLSSHGVESFHGRLVPGSEGPWFRPAVLDVSRPCPSSQGVHQLSRTTQIRSEGPQFRPASQTIQDRVQVTAGLTHCPGDSGPCPSAHGVDQQSRENQASAGGPTVSTSCPRRLGTVNKGPRCRSGFPGYSGPCPSARGFDHLSCVTRARV